MPAEVLRAWRARIEAVLEAALPTDLDAPAALTAAMRYAALGGGKRLRPLLVYAAGQACGACEEILDAPAAAVELIHAYSLVHDDLPAMDDDALRRGQATVHVAFDEATAILAGDALQTLAFSVLAEASADAELRVEWLRTLAEASGARGMCGGQALDMAATGNKNRCEKRGQEKRCQGHFPEESVPGTVFVRIERMHALKTGALIRASVRLGALAAGASVAKLKTLDRYAAALGLAFQIRDDILDVEGDSQALGKTAGKDASQDKATYPALLGMAETKARLAALSSEMDDCLRDYGPRADALRALGKLAVQRQH